MAVSTGVFSIVGELLTGFTNAVSGTAWFYSPGTLTPTVVYGDDIGTAISNPVALDSSGRAKVYLSQLARMVVQTAGGVTVADVVINRSTDTEVAVSSTAFTATTADGAFNSALTAFGGQDFRYVPGTGAGGMLPIDWMNGVVRNVMAYAASTAPTINDGVTPADTAIAAAIAAVVAAGGGVVYFPPGTYLIQNALAISNATGVTMKGAGIGATAIKSNNTSANAITATSCTSFVVEDMNITHTSTSSGNAIALVGCTGATLRRVGVDGVTMSGKYGTGISCTGAFTNIRVENCDVATTGSGNIAGYFFGSGTAQYVWIVNSRLWGGVAVRFDGTTSRVLLAGCSVQGTVLWSSSLTGLTYHVVGNQFNGATVTVSTATDPIIFQAGNGWPGHTASFAVGTTQTPQWVSGTSHLSATSGGAGTVTVNPPAPTSFSSGRPVLYITFTNASGGAVTWTLDAIYKVTGAIPTTDGHSITVGFEYDVEATKWREVSRADTTT